MFTNGLKKVSTNVVVKHQLISTSQSKAFVYSMLGGAYIGIGMFFMYTVTGGLFNANSPWVKLIMGLTFPIAPILISFAGADLFSTDTMFCTSSLLRKELKIGEVSKVLLMSFFGNWIGGIIFAVLIYFTGFLNQDSAAFNHIIFGAAYKMSASSTNLFFRGLVGNIIICLGIWMAMQVESTTSKIIFVSFALFTFISSSFENSPANMSFLTMGMLAKSFGYEDGKNIIINSVPIAEYLSNINIASYFRNIFVTGLGNLTGGAVIAGCYYFISGRNSEIVQK